MQRVAKETHFDVDENELAKGQEDGTEILICGIKKRSKEMYLTEWNIRLKINDVI